MAMSLLDTLVAFGEYLDAQDMCYTPSEHGLDDNLTHEDIAKAFIKYWSEVPGRATLAGENVDASQAATDALVQLLKCGDSDNVLGAAKAILDRGL